jgi:hypothetical protein
VRFYWKKESSFAGTKAGKAKILRVRLIIYNELIRMSASPRILTYMISVLMSLRNHWIWVESLKENLEKKKITKGSKVKMLP